MSEGHSGIPKQLPDEHR